MRLGFLKFYYTTTLSHSIVIVVFAINYELTYIELVDAVVTLNPAAGYLRGCLKNSKSVKE